MNDYQEQQLIDENSDDRTINKKIGLLYSLVLMGAAALILILFEDIIRINLYIIYMAVGLILGLSVVLILHLFLKKI